MTFAAMNGGSALTPPRRAARGGRPGPGTSPGRARGDGCPDMRQGPARTLRRVQAGPRRSGALLGHRLPLAAQ